MVVDNHYVDYDVVHMNYVPLMAMVVGVADVVRLQIHCLHMAAVVGDHNHHDHNKMHVDDVEDASLDHSCPVSYVIHKDFDYHLRYLEAVAVHLQVLLNSIVVDNVAAVDQDLDHNHDPVEHPKEKDEVVAVDNHCLNEVEVVLNWAVDHLYGHKMILIRTKRIDSDTFVTITIFHTCSIWHRWIMLGLSCGSVLMTRWWLWRWRLLRSGCRFGPTSRG